MENANHVAVTITVSVVPQAIRVADTVIATGAKSAIKHQKKEGMEYLYPPS